MKKLLLKFSPVILLCFFVQLLQAQESNDTITYRIMTIDGNTHIGTIVKRDSSFCIFKTDLLGDIKIPTKHIKSMHALDRAVIKNGTYWLENPQSTRYFWSPNGYGLKKGEGYYQNIWVMYSQVAVGVTDQFSIGGGLIPLFIFDGAPTPVWITPKFSLPVVKDKFNLGLGGLFGNVIGIDDGLFGIVYGTTTYGSRDQNLTIGVGWGYAGDEWADTPLINICGMIRTGPRGYIITENYYLDTGPDHLLLLSLGGRQIIKNVGLDYGAVIPLHKELDAFIAIPWLGFTIPFGNR